MRSTFPVPATLERRRIAVFLGIAFGVSVLLSLVVWQTGGLIDSPELVPGVPLWFVLVSGPMMFSPAVAVLPWLALDAHLLWDDRRLDPRAARPAR